ncbi:hypothetical protein Dsin_017760 [Dipteronia sinensis]|uniref:RNase H type-1 domain-containing protein n=1 Tax=Dipteronia sinensis TaxID=43782 RepID=A0AAE0AFM9_9ROSI|nr:hypothetical protein Dsin_017760 [Dipteronia sinensis]
MMPLVGVFKINTDAPLNNRDKVSGIGMVIRDCNGHVMASMCHNIRVCFQPHIAEAMAILRGLHLAIETGLVPASLESDALSVVKAIDSTVSSSA